MGKQTLTVLPNGAVTRIHGAWSNGTQQQHVFVEGFKTSPSAWSSLFDCPSPVFSSRPTLLSLLIHAFKAMWDSRKLLMLSLRQSQTGKGENPPMIFANNRQQ